MWYRECFVPKHGFQRELLIIKTKLQYDIKLHPDIQNKAATHHSAKDCREQDNRGYGVSQHISMGRGIET